jgi:hypothetical protein
MIVVGIILSFVGLGFLCWLLFTLLCAQPHKSANVALQKCGAEQIRAAHQRNPAISAPHIQ